MKRLYLFRSAGGHASPSALVRFGALRTLSLSLAPFSSTSKAECSLYKFRKRIHSFKDAFLATTFVFLVDIFVSFASRLFRFLLLQDYSVSCCGRSVCRRFIWFSFSRADELKRCFTRGVSFLKTFFFSLGFLWHSFSLWRVFFFRKFLLIGLQAFWIGLDPLTKSPSLHPSYPPCIYILHSLFISLFPSSPSRPFSPNPSFVLTSPLSCDAPRLPALVFIHTNLGCPQSYIGLRIFWPSRLKTPPPAYDIIKA